MVIGSKVCGRMWTGICHNCLPHCLQDLEFTSKQVKVPKKLTECFQILSSGSPEIYSSLHCAWVCPVSTKHCSMQFSILKSKKNTSGYDLTPAIGSVAEPENQSVPVSVALIQE